MSCTCRQIALVAALLLAGCTTVPYARHGVLPEAVQAAAGSAEREALNARVYDAAVGHVERLFYRKDFGGVDFPGQARAQRAAVLAQPDEAGLYAGLGELLALLDDAHSYAVGPTERERIQARKAGQERAGYGIVLTVAGDDHIVAMVRPDSPAAEAGVLPGWRMISVGGHPVRSSRPAEAGRTETVVFLDEDEVEHVLELTARNMPPLPRHERRDLDDGVVYLRFDDFDRDTRRWFAGQMETLATAPPRGLVLDLRRNGGGLLRSAALIHGHFHAERQPFAVMEHRFFSRRVSARAPRHAYTGPLTVLVGPASASAAELLAARLQETGRARIVGQPTRGAVVGTRGINLPDGGLLHVGMLGMTTAAGRVLETIGVTPDVAVATDWAAAREGRDPALETALVELPADDSPTGRDG